MSAPEIPTEKTTLRSKFERVVARLEAADLLSTLKGAGVVMAIRLTGGLGTLLLQVFLARWLGLFEYGIYAYVWVWIYMLALVAPMGLNDGAVKFIAEYLGKEDWAHLHGVMRVVTFLPIVSSIASALMGAFVIWMLSDQIEAYYVLPLLTGMIFVPLFSVADVQEGVARGFGWMNFAYIPNYIFRPLMVVLFTGGAYYIFGSANAVTAIWAGIAAIAISMTVQRVLLSRKIRTTVKAAEPSYKTRAWVIYSAPLILICTFELILANMDMIMLGYFKDPDVVGVYFSATRIHNLVCFIQFAAVSIAAPRFSRLHAMGSLDELNQFMKGIAHLMFWPTLGAFLFLLVFGSWVLSWFGEGFEAGYLAMVILVGGLLVRNTVGPIEYLLNMTGNQNASLMALGTAGIVNLCFNALWIPDYGMQGAAMATALSYVVGTSLLVILLKRRLGMTSFVFLNWPKLS